MTATSFSFISVVLFICLSSVVVDAQSTTATLTGIVKDQSEAVVPGVKISVISIANGFQRATVTDQDGTFTVPLLSPGTYTVKADRVGFSPTEVRNIVLNVSDVKEILLYLKVGEISQTVEIVEALTCAISRQSFRQSSISNFFKIFPPAHVSEEERYRNQG
jgi:hypothetical protein